MNLTGSPGEAISAAATEPYDRGLYYLRLDVQDFDEALRSLQKAAALDPRSPLPPARMVETEVTKFEDVPSPDLLERAQQYLQVAESLGPDSVRVHLAAGMLKKAQDHYEEALQEYQRVAELEPRNIDAFVQIARVYEKLDMADKAIESYRRAVGLDPTFYEPHQYFGVFYYGQGRYSEAANEFQRAIDLAPQFLNAYANLGAMYEKLGRTADAERVLRSALTLKKAPRLLANMGSLLLAEKRFAEARPYLQEAAGVMPNDYLVILNLADADRHLGYGAEARTNYRKGMELALAELSQSPRSWLPRAFVAYFAARLGSRRRAQDEIRQALRASPGWRG